jgi:AcrR family transcriptional regulator
VAERAGLGERPVYRHFPTEQHLHRAVMQRLEDEAGITYEDVELANLAEVTGRVFASLRSFAVRASVEAPDDPTFVAVDDRQRRATPVGRRPHSPATVSDVSSPVAMKSSKVATSCSSSSPRTVSASSSNRSNNTSNA